MCTLENMVCPRLRAKCVLLNRSISVAGICNTKHQKPHLQENCPPRRPFIPDLLIQMLLFTAF